VLVTVLVRTAALAIDAVMVRVEVTVLVAHWPWVQRWQSTELGYCFSCSNLFRTEDAASFTEKPPASKTDPELVERFWTPKGVGPDTDSLYPNAGIAERTGVKEGPATAVTVTVSAAPVVETTMVVIVTTLAATVLVRTLVVVEVQGVSCDFHTVL
jgi:hypothetical protein